MCFFFSSRRRHTRFDCDWSSDVCSSDLAAAGVRRIEAVTGPGADALIRKLEGELEQAAGVLRTQPEDLVHRVGQLLEANRKREKRGEELLKTGGGERGKGEGGGDGGGEVHKARFRPA